MFDAVKFLGVVLTGAASATGVHLVGQMVPGSYGVKIGAQVATTAAVTGALHVGGAPDHIRDAAAIGGAGAVAVRVSDELALYQAVAKLREGSTTSNGSNAGASNGSNATTGNGSNATTGSLGDGRRAGSWYGARSRAAV